MRRPQLDHADWHVTARGARRLLLFHDDADFATFYALLGESCRDSGMGLIADCLMSNHFHLSLSGGTKALTRCMQRLNRSYSGYHNERYDLSGHAFEQAYYAEPIPSDFILKRVVRYIHLNPVRGGRVSTPELYPWSSFQRLSTAPPGTLGQEELRVLHLFDPDYRAAQNVYKAFTSKDLHRKYIPAAGRTPAWELWQEQFTWILDHTMENEAILDPIAPEAVAVYLGSQIGIPPRAMGRVLNHQDGRQVSVILRTIRRQLESNPAAHSKIRLLRIL